jgi:Cu(I)/Ag(I) efflux system periplasmic protein CusF
MNRIATLALSGTLSVVMSSIVFAQASDVGKKDSSGMNMKSMDMKGMEMKGMEMNKKTVATDHHGVGVIKEINAARGVVTLAHEPIRSLNWPAMTMGFKVKDKTLLDNIKPGNKVDFTLVQAGKDYVITSIK